MAPDPVEAALCDHERGTGGPFAMPLGGAGNSLRAEQRSRASPSPPDRRTDCAVRSTIPGGGRFTELSECR